jgi:hypothetical protein
VIVKINEHIAVDFNFFPYLDDVVYEVMQIREYLPFHDYDSHNDVYNDAGLGL